MGIISLSWRTARYIAGVAMMPGNLVTVRAFPLAGVVSQLPESLVTARRAVAQGWRLETIIPWRSLPTVHLDMGPQRFIAARIRSVLGRLGFATGKREAGPVRVAMITIGPPFAGGNVIFNCAEA